jgi:aspergillopepsin I
MAAPPHPLLALQSVHSLRILIPHSLFLPSTKMISLTTVLALAVAAQAAPTAEKRVANTFSIPAIHNTQHVRNGTAAMLKAYKKFGLKPTQQFSDSFINEITASRKRQDGTATASPDPNNVEYLVPVTIGGENLNLDFDSGSADL